MAKKNLYHPKRKSYRPKKKKYRLKFFDGDKWHYYTYINKKLYNKAVIIQKYQNNKWEY